MKALNDGPNESKGSQMLRCQRTAFALGCHIGKGFDQAAVGTGAFSPPADRAADVLAQRQKNGRTKSIALPLIESEPS